MKFHWAAPHILPFAQTACASYRHMVSSHSGVDGPRDFSENKIKRPKDGFLAAAFWYVRIRTSHKGTCLENWVWEESATTQWCQGNPFLLQQCVQLCSTHHLESQPIVRQSNDKLCRCLRLAPTHFAQVIRCTCTRNISPLTGTWSSLFLSLAIMYNYWDICYVTWCVY